MLAATKPRLLVALAVSAAGIAWLVTRETSDDVPRCVPTTVAPSPTPIVTPPLPAKPAPSAPAFTCLGPWPHLAANEARPVVCAPGAGCFAFDLTSGAMTNVKHVDVYARRVDLVHDRRARTVCRESACVHVGSTLLTVLDSFADPKLDATTDLQTIIVEQRLVWSVQRDAPISLRTAGSGTWQGHVTALGNLLLADWASCAGPCDATTIHDSRGRVIGRPLDGTAAIIPIDRRRYAFVGVSGALTMVDTAGRALASHAVETYSKWDFSPEAVRIGSDEHPQLAVLRTRWEKHDVAIVSLFDVASDSFRLVTEHEFPVCPDPDHPVPDENAR